jgi:hypothetical protein
MHMEMGKTSSLLMKLTNLYLEYVSLMRFGVLGNCVIEDRR